jgi:hypothetical protein
MSAHSPLLQGCHIADAGISGSVSNCDPLDYNVIDFSDFHDQQFNLYNAPHSPLSASPGSASLNHHSSLNNLNELTNGFQLSQSLGIDTSNLYSNYSTSPSLKNSKSFDLNDFSNGYTMGNELPQTDLWVKNQVSNSEYSQTMHSALPDGKFWKTVKTDGQTLYQCPWEGCDKSKLLNNISIYEAIQPEITLSWAYWRETICL